LREAIVSVSSGFEGGTSSFVEVDGGQPFKLRLHAKAIHTVRTGFKRKFCMRREKKVEGTTDENRNGL